jgi:preprotein translocase subunit SecD
MKFPLPFVLAAMLLSAWSFAAQPALGCKLSIYSLDANQSSLGEQIVSPDQVVSASYGISKIVAGGSILQVHLTTSGATANRDFTINNIGKKIAILCNDKVIARPTIAGQSGATFVIEGVKRP